MWHLHHQLQTSVVGIKGIDRGITASPDKLVVLHLIDVFEAVVWNDAMKDIVVSFLTNVFQLFLGNCIFLFVVGDFVNILHDVILRFDAVHNILVGLGVDKFVHNGSIQFRTVQS